MLIVLDTNIFQEDFLMRTGRMQVLLDYIERTQASLVIPRIVLDELTANYERELQKRTTAMIRAREQLNGIRLIKDDTRTELDISAETAQYIASIKKKLSIGSNDVLEYRPNYLESVLQRAIRRIRPCTERGEEIRDAILWHSILDAAEERREPVLFISRNTDQFTNDKVALHPDLAREASERGVDVHFVPSLEEFAKQHATRIAFITKEWIEAEIDGDLVLDAAYDTFIEKAWEIAKTRLTWGEELEGAHLQHGGVEVDEFFVYQMASGEIRLEATWFGVLNIAYDIDVTESDYMSSRTGRFYRHSREREVEVSLHVVVQALIRDGKLIEWSKLDAWAESY